MILFIVLGLTIIIAGMLVYGSIRWKSATKEMHRKLEAERLPMEPKTYDQRELES